MVTGNLAIKGVRVGGSHTLAPTWGRSRLGVRVSRTSGCSALRASGLPGVEGGRTWDLRAVLHGGGQ